MRKGEKITKKTDKQELFFGDVREKLTLSLDYFFDTTDFFLFEPAIENGKKRERGWNWRDCEMNWFDRYTGEGSDLCGAE